MSSLALFWGLLNGNAPVYYIYSDEAGTSQHEPVTIVVGVILNADRSWMVTKNKLQSIINEHVPESLKTGFVFHAKDVLNGYREYDESWPRAKRIDLIRAVASIPRELELAISVGKVRRDFIFPRLPRGMKLYDFHHILAFGQCMARANKYIQDWADQDEVATLVAEDVQKKRAFLKKALKMKPAQFPITEEFVRPTHADIIGGRITQTASGPIERIIDTVHFVDKNEAPLLQIADACAFSFRRYLAEERYGSELVQGMLGGDLFWDDWQGPLSEMVFSFNSAHQYPNH